MPNVNLKPEDRLYFVQSFIKESQSVGYFVIQKVGKKYIHLNGHRKVDIETLQEVTESYHNRRQYYVSMDAAKEAIDRNSEIVRCEKLFSQAYRCGSYSIYKDKSLERIKEFAEVLENFLQK